MSKIRIWVIAALLGIAFSPAARLTVSAQSPPPTVLEPATPGSPQASTLIGKEDCSPVYPDIAHAVFAGGAWKLVQHDVWMLSFGSNKSDAFVAERIVKYYRFDKQCFVRRPGPTMSYWLVGENSPVGSIMGEDCTSFDPSKIEAGSIAGRESIIDGGVNLLDFRDHSEATQALQIIKYYNFTHLCFVGRQTFEMVYLRR
jgi:hypothetical protein